ncbi:hypothetical protein EGW08_009854 [Elysia chlorotica]|uniref:Myosin motor domain-containing protein n=1 Tax=Elysia chlorotica TaxID=188477 RepID=A0A433TLF2_ELYCH|nr:hypothetical protein EGW08_009854 [Elysia chlorotica]
MSLQENTPLSRWNSGSTDQKFEGSVLAKTTTSKSTGSESFTVGQLVYKRDDQHGWVPATVVGICEGTVILELHDGQRIKQKPSSLLLQCEHCDLAKISNLTEVTPINEATVVIMCSILCQLIKLTYPIPYYPKPCLTISMCPVLECLDRRFAADRFYSLAGSTVIAVNPFKDASELYTMASIWEYDSRKNKQSVEPHVYVVADEAYTRMKRRLGWVNQSIVVSGESGAGKTVSAKHLLRYLTIVSTPEGGIDLDTSVPASVIERRVLDSNPLLEAFGNAATPRNDNSSRFGKFIQLQFHRNGTILGGVIQTYLLEKTRVVHQRQGENNFHIFYQLLALQEERQVPDFLAPIKAEIQASRLECSLLPQDQSHSLTTTLNAMSEIGIGAASQTLLAILHLTTLKFLPERDGESSGYSEDQGSEEDRQRLIETVRAKEESARLLGVCSQRLHHSLLNRSIVSGDNSHSGTRRSVFQKPVMVAEAESRRDCLAMLLYSRLFDWLVAFINHQIKVESFDHSIGLLDIYGFEAFEENSLEQLCINYANERLQQHYVTHFLRDLQREYESEGIVWTSIPYTDNKLCVDALDGSTGVFGVLNEDHIPPELISLLHSSSNGFVLQLFADCQSPSPETKASHVVKSHRKKTVLTSFKSSLDSLLASLAQSDVHYIRCIKPNPHGQPDEFDRAFVLQQLRACGIIQTVDICRRGYPASSLDSLLASLAQSDVHYIRCIKPNPYGQPDQFDRAFVLQQLRACGIIQTVDICRRGYPARMTYKDFVRRYKVFTRMKKDLDKILSSQPNPTPCGDSAETNKENLRNDGESFTATVERHISKLEKTSNVLREMENQQHLQRRCASILETMFEARLLVGVEVQFGHSKIFLSQVQVEHLEEARSRAVHLVVCRAQACWRGFSQRRKHRHMCRAARVIQTAWRAHCERRRFQAMYEAALIIQTAWRAHCEKRLFQSMCQAARVIQAVWRAHCEKRRFRAMCQAVLVIQRSWSRHRLRRSLGSLSRASRTVKRSLLKWVRRGRFKRSLEKLRVHREKVRETAEEETSNTYLAFYQSCESLEYHMPQEISEYASTSAVSDHHVQHSEPTGLLQSPPLLSLCIDNEDVIDEGGNPLGGMGHSSKEERTHSHPDGSADSPDLDILVSSGHWSEDSGIMTQSESSSAPGNAASAAAVDNGQENTPSSVADLEISGNHPRHSLSAVKRPREVLAVDKDANPNQSGQDGQDVRSPTLKKKCMSGGRDERAGGDGSKSRRGRRREDLYMADGVLTCRRLTRSGYRFHVRSSVLKHGHRTHHSYLPHGLPDALPDPDEEDGDNQRR